MPLMDVRDPKNLGRYCVKYGASGKVYCDSPTPAGKKRARAKAWAQGKAILIQQGNVPGITPRE